MSRDTSRCSACDGPMLQRRRRYRRGIVFASALRTHAHVRTGRKKRGRFCGSSRVDASCAARRLSASILGGAQHGRYGRDACTQAADLPVPSLQRKGREARPICRFRVCSERGERARGARGERGGAPARGARAATRESRGARAGTPREARGRVRRRGRRAAAWRAGGSAGRPRRRPRAAGRRASARWRGREGEREGETST